MTLHERAENRTLNNVKNLTVKKLNKLDDNGNTVWHVAARNDSLYQINKDLFTVEALSQINNFKENVWYIAAMENTLRDIPKHLFNEKGMKQISRRGDTAWHMAAKCQTLKHIPKHLFTFEALFTRDANGYTVWHHAVIRNTLKDIPKHLFTPEVFEYCNNNGETVFDLVLEYNHNITAFPKRLFTETLVNLFCERTRLFSDNNVLKHIPVYLFTNKMLKSGFEGENLEYIDYVLQMPDRLQAFIENNSNLEHDIEFRDPRLKLVKADTNLLYFELDGLTVILL